MLSKYLNNSSNVLKSYISNIYNSIANVLIYYLINNYYGIEVLGELIILTQTTSLLSEVTSFKFSDSLVKFIVDSKNNNNYFNLVKSYIIISVCLSVLYLIIFSLFIYLLIDPISTFLIKGKLEVNIISYLIGIQGTNIFINQIISFFQSNNDFDKFYLNRYITVTLKIILVLTHIFYFKNLNIIGLLQIYFYCNLITFLILLILFYNNFNRSIGFEYFKFDKSKAKIFLLYNFKTFTSNILKIGNIKVIDLILAYYTNTTTVGVFSTLKKLTVPLKLFVSPMIDIYYPKMVQKFNKNQIKSINNTLNQVLIIILCFSFFYFIFLIPFFKYFSMLFLNNEKVLLEALLLILSELLLMVVWWRKLFSLSVNPKIGIYANIIFLCLNSLLIVYIKFYGIFGFLLGQILNAIIMIVYYYSMKYIYLRNKI